MMGLLKNVKENIKVNKRFHLNNCLKPKEIKIIWYFIKIAKFREK